MTDPSRRRFLQVTLLSAAAASLTLAGCGGDDDDAGDSGPLPGAAFFPQSLASGDPKPNSVVLWTRVADAAAGGNTLGLRLQLAQDSDFNKIVLNFDGLLAETAHDRCIKVKVTDLQPATTYYYRFIYRKDSVDYASNTGRTRTAPTADADTPVRFAVLNCQDYIGRYYNTLAWLLQQTPEPDFVAYVGDYIYETTGDPRFQTPGGTRTISFSDTAGAIALGSGSATYYAASSVSNYREIYQRYRTDRMLQQVQERFPMIAIWDDHEYSDDCYGATATYFNGLKAEIDSSRRQRAEQVFFEYMPVDDSAATATGPFATSASKLFPNTVLYREFRFGRHLHLVCTDTRSFRPDHRIPEDAFPGMVVMDKAALIAVFNAQSPGNGAAIYEQQKTFFGPYVDLSVAPWNAYQPALIPVLTQAYIQAGLSAAQAATKAAADLAGKTSAFVVNQLIQLFNAAVAAGQVPGASRLPLIEEPTYSALDRGIAYLHLGKTAFFSEFGSRYGVVEATYSLYAAYQQATGQNRENVFGDAQQAWFNQRLASSDATFMAVASSVSTTSLVWDLSAETTLPADYQTRFLVNVDQWDGFPNRRAQLLAALKQRGNSFLFAGDIHSAFVTDHGGVADFTSPAVSSETFGNFVGTAIQVVAAGFTSAQQQRLQELLVTNLDATLKAGFNKLVLADTGSHGFILIEVSGDQTVAAYHLLAAAEVTKSYYDDPKALAGKVQIKRFAYRKGDNKVVTLA